MIFYAEDYERWEDTEDPGWSYAMTPDTKEVYPEFETRDQFYKWINICEKAIDGKYCCCNCQNQLVVYRHPLNKNGIGGVTETFGYACYVPDFGHDDNGRKKIVFMDQREHGCCEMRSTRKGFASD